MPPALAAPQRPRVLPWLAEAAWLDAARARAWRNVLLAVSGVAVVIWCATARHGLDLAGKPLGTDFTSFYAASQLALRGAPAAAYSPQAHHAAEIALFGRDTGHAAFFYPPLFLLICAPLALAPYGLALAAWLAATGAAFVAAVRAWLDRGFGWTTILAFPAVLLNAGHGQNAFLSAALLGAGGLWLDRRPILAGVAFGLLAYKPHLGLMLPVALIAAGRWRSFVSAAVTVAAFVAASTAAFGAETWRGFLAGSAIARATLEQGLVEPGKMTSLFAGMRALGAPVALAYAAQAGLALVVAAALVWAHRRSPRGPAEAPLLVSASLLATPFLLDYDLAILALPLAWLASTGAREGYRPWEKLVLVAGFVLPLVARPLALSTHLPLAPAVLLAIFLLVLRRVTSAVPQGTK